MKQKIRKVCDLELKDLNPTKGIVEFYFGAWTVDQDGDQILPVAYSKTLKENKSRIYHNRDHSEVVGSPISFGTDENGAWVASQLALKTIHGRDMFEQYDAGIVKGHSQEFETLIADRTSEGRTIKEVRLWGVTSVTRIPAHLDTPTISLKSYEDAADQLEKINKLLTTGNISDELGERLMKEVKMLNEIIERKSAEIESKKKPKGIDFGFLVNNL